MAFIIAASAVLIATIGLIPQALEWSIERLIMAP
jgi:hypothetical protein